ncbi:hypothetical protein ABZ135_23400 [Streptomyces sp. NPDC006339]|uniref:hypothetical protein n=1 Tax=Streptomyces sp. NPDC006339 TaxID=3156755 RepID=UPI0033A1A87B
MKFASKLAAVGAATASLVLLGAGGAHAQDNDGPLSSLLSAPGRILGCLIPSGCDNDTGGGVTGAQAVSNTEELAPGEYTVVVAHCPQGQVATGGGFHAGSGIDLESSGPNLALSETQPNGWTASGRNIGQGPALLGATAVCVDAAQ